MTRYSKVLLAGGGGVVGQQVAAILRRRNPDLGIILAGRRIDALRDRAARLDASAVALDIDAPELPPTSGDTIVVGLANDLQDRLLVAVLEAGLPYVDVTRWTERLKQALVTVAAYGRPAEPTVFSSSWMAGTAGLVARSIATNFEKVDQVDIDILFALADRAGPNSTAYMDRLSVPFHTMERSDWRQRSGFRDGRMADFGEGGTHKVYRFDTPDQASLPGLTGAHTVNARIAFDSPSSSGLLHALVVSGIWRMLSRPTFDSVRRAILYNPGQGAAHRVRVSVLGSDHQESPMLRAMHVVDPKGQTHLTALGAVLQVENLIGRHGAAPSAGVYLGEAIVDPKMAIDMLKSEGVTIE